MPFEMIETPVAFQDNGKPGKPVTDEIATARTDIDLFAGFLKALQNPDTIFREAPARGIRIYRDIAKDPQVRSTFQTRRLAVVNKEWEIQAASEDAADVRRRDFVEAALNAIPGFERGRYDLLDGIHTGFAVGEVLWHVSPTPVSGLRSPILPTAIKRRGQHRFVFDFDGQLRILTRANMVDGEELPARKFLLFQYEADDENPYGVGLGQSLYWPWWFKKHGIKFWLLFLERFGMPTIEGKFPTGTDKAVQTKLLAVLKAIQQDTAYIIPENMSVELKEAQRGATVSVYDPFLARMDGYISKVIVGQTATTEGTPGALGSEEARSEVRHELVEADADLLDEVITNQLIRWIVDFNFGPAVPAPFFHTQTEVSEDLDARATRDHLLHQMGTRIPEKYVHDTYGIPVPEGDEAVLPAPSPGAGFAPAGVSFAEAQDADTLPGIRARRRLEAAAARRGVAAFDPIRRTIEADLDKKKELSAALAGLTEATVTDADLTPYALLVRDGLLTADLMGRWHVRREALAALSENSQFEIRNSKLPVVFQELPLTPEEALAFFREKIALSEEQFASLAETMRARGFTVARISNRQAVEFIRAEIERAIREGATYAQFRARLEKSWDRFGITEVSPHHLETVFNNNVGEAYMKGRGKQYFEDPEIVEDFPFIQYHSALLPTSRPNHVAMHGVIRSRHDPVWQIWWPLNGHNCHCSVTAISRQEIALRGITETPVPNVLPDPGWESGPLG